MCNHYILLLPPLAPYLLGPLCVQIAKCKLVTVLAGLEGNVYFPNGVAIRSALLRVGEGERERKGGFIWTSRVQYRTSTIIFTWQRAMAVIN